MCFRRFTNFTSKCFEFHAVFSDSSNLFQRFFSSKTHPIIHMVISNDNMAPWTEAEEGPINETPVNQDAGKTRLFLF